jgi:hypothetical protein
MIAYSKGTAEDEAVNLCCVFAWSLIAGMFLGLAILMLYWGSRGG